MLTRPIPRTGEPLPVLGLGTFRSFDQTLTTAPTRQALTEVLRLLRAAGGTIVDSSPMYGRAEAVVGELLEAEALHDQVFLATKVWTRGRKDGVKAMEDSLKLLRAKSIALMQVHNLVDCETHLATLREWKEAGRIRYIGITHYTPRAFDELMDVMRTHPDVDFCQFPYSVIDRDAEDEFLAFCADNGVATMINRPFDQDALFARTGGVELPGLARELGCTSWAQFALKYVLGNEAVTCAIPATGKPHHMRDNLQALDGRLPDAGERKRMAQAFDGL